MRNIEILMNNAISDSKNWKLANTEVTFDQESGHSRVYLHGNHIATVGENFVTVTDAGYQTRTTKSRLNAIIRDGHCVEGEVFIRSVVSGLSQFVSVKITKLHTFPSSVLSPSSDHDTN